MMPGSGIDDAVRADFRRVGDREPDAVIDAGIADDQRLDREIFGAQPPQVEQGWRHHRRDNRRRDRGPLHPFQLHQLRQPDGIFVGGSAMFGGNAPAVLNHAAVHQGEDNIGISDVDGEQHDLTLPQSTMNNLAPDGDRDRCAASPKSDTI